MQILVDGDVVLYMALHSADEDTIESCIERYVGILTDVAELHFVEADNLEVFLSDPNTNFRKINYPSYKANRKSRVAPTHLPALKQWVFDNVENVKGSPNGEADDYMLIRAAELDEEGLPWVIATIDKDLLTHPGRFYNLRRRDWETVSGDEAYLFMIQQFVMGDPGDCIGGIRGFGPKKTENLINSYHSLEDNYAKAKEVWKDNYGKGWQKAYNETANLAFIRRDPSDLVTLDFAGMPFDVFREKLRIHI